MLSCPWDGKGKVPPLDLPTVYTAAGCTRVVDQPCLSAAVSVAQVAGTAIATMAAVDLLLWFSGRFGMRTLC